jgi:hypothetical protein
LKINGPIFIRLLVELIELFISFYPQAMGEDTASIKSGVQAMKNGSGEDPYKNCY